MIRLLPTTIGAVLLCLLSLDSIAQFSLSGVVLNKTGNTPLPGASLHLTQGDLSQLANENGRFEFSGLAPGKYLLEITFVGFSKYQTTIELNADVRLEVQLEEIAMLADEVIVSALRAGENTPTTYTNVGKDALGKQNYGQDLPFLLNWTPSLVTTSDAGIGVGYTGLRIRGSDATHINVTINGIPYNDSESQSVYWVDVPDIASSTESIQVQRGVGTSTNGAGAFGGSVNVQTNAVQTQPYSEISNSYGSFNTRKHTLKAGTGLINKVWAFDGRISKIKSDGYIDRASSDLDSYYLSGGYYGKRTLIKAIAFGGHEQTYQAWYGVDPDMMKVNRRFNYAGAIYDSTGQASRFYDKQVDDYHQDHYQLHFSRQLTPAWLLTSALHYTYGRGYFEEYLQGASYADLRLNNVVVANDTLTSSDFVTRQWLNNRFYGATYALIYTGKRFNFTAGGAINQYGNARHYGEIIWAQFAGAIQPGDRYYNGISQKTDFNFYTKLTYDITPALNAFVDLQYRSVDYHTHGSDDDRASYDIKDRFHFFNPKAGLSYTLSSNDILYTSYAIANREPTRADYLGGEEKPSSERLGNVETGWRRNSSRYRLEVNYYYMNYNDQLVLTGRLNSGGYPIRANVGKSFRTGVELSGTVDISSQLKWNLNATWSMNKNKEIVVVDGNDEAKTYRNTDLILSPNWIAGSQLLWSPVKGATFGILSKYVGKQYLDNTQRESVAISSYFLNDIRASYTLHPDFVKAIEFGVLANNIFGRQYISNGAVYGDTPYYYPQAGRNYMARVTLQF